MRLCGIKLKHDEIATAFSGPDGERLPPILHVKQVAAMLGVTVKTTYDWVSHKRLDGTFRKRGKHLLFWRDRVIDAIFNGKEWPSERRKRDDGSGRCQPVHSRQEENLDS